MVDKISKLSPETYVPIGSLLIICSLLVSFTLWINAQLYGIKTELMNIRTKIEYDSRQFNSDLLSLRAEVEGCKKSVWTTKDHIQFVTSLKLANPTIVIPEHLFRSIDGNEGH